MLEALAHAYPPGRRWWQHLASPATDPWTYVRWAHLLFVVQVSLFYLVTLGVLVSLGAVLIWTWFGPALLLLALYLSRWAGDVEAWLVRRVSRIELRRPPTAIERDEPFRQQVWTRLSDPTTWTGLAYLVTQTAFGIVGFLVIVVMTFFAVSLCLAPFFVSAELPLQFGLRPGVTMWVVDKPSEAWWLPFLGIAMLYIECHLVNVVSALHAHWARLMLGSRAPHIEPGAPLLPPTTDDGPGGGPADLDDGSGRGGGVPSGQPVASAATLSLGSEAETTALAVASLAALTQREREVLTLIAQGYSNAEMAEAFVISEGTVKTHVKRILAKLGLRDRTQAAIWALQHASPTAAAINANQIRERLKAVEVPDGSS